MLDGVRSFSERRVIGAELDDWLALDKAEEYFAWLETPAHADSALGLLRRGPDRWACTAWPPARRHAAAMALMRSGRWAAPTSRACFGVFI